MSGMPPDLEQNIRDLGNYVEKQMKDLLDAKRGVNVSALRIGFRAIVGTQLMDAILRYDFMDYTNFGLKPREGWLKELQRVVDYAEAQNSDAADKIKKALPVATQLDEEFKKDDVHGIRAKIRYAKSKGIAY